MPIVKAPYHSVHVHTVPISSAVIPASLSSNNTTYTHTDTHTFLQLICASCAALAQRLEIHFEFSLGADRP